MASFDRIDASTPILVGQGVVSDQTTPIEAGRSPMDLIAAAGKLALADAAADGLAAAIDTVAVVRLFSDSAARYESKLGRSTNPPASVAERLGLSGGRRIYSQVGGDMPQRLVNHFAGQIVAGHTRATLIAGGEALRTQRAAESAGLNISWHEDSGAEPEGFGEARRAWSDEEGRHQMQAPAVMYALIENAIRGAKRQSSGEHLGSMSRLMARFAAVARENSLAARREGYSAERLATADEQNRFIASPYPRLMTAHVYVDQAAALILTSVGVARRLGIDPEKWIFLHGCSAAQDHWYLTERPRLDASPAIRYASRAALDMAGRNLADIRYIDLYSCFPAAVEVACQELGLAGNDPRGLTLTGGLPYFGGPGNSYVLFSIAQMMSRLRSAPGAFGLVTGMGNYLTKHTFGVYSGVPVQGRWTADDSKGLQEELDRLPKATLTTRPNGRATIESYTVEYGKSGAERGIVLGRLEQTGQRFCALTGSDPKTLADLEATESLGRGGTVTSGDLHHSFVPDTA